MRSNTTFVQDTSCPSSPKEPLNPAPMTRPMVASSSSAISNPTQVSDRRRPDRVWLIVPVALGLFLGVVPVIQGQIPDAIALWSGMLLWGNHFGYVLGALIVAYFTAETWWRAFWHSTLTIVLANAVYYGLIEILGVLEISNYNFTNGLVDIVFGMIVWSVFGAICGALAATAARFIRFGKTPRLRVAAATAAFLGLLAVVFLGYGIVTFNFLRNLDPDIVSRYVNGMFAGRSLWADVLWMAVAALASTVLFVATLRTQRQVPTTSSQCA